MQKINKKSAIVDGIVVDCSELKREQRGLLFKKVYVLIAYKHAEYSDRGELLFINTVAKWVPEDNIFDYE